MLSVGTNFAPARELYSGSLDHNVGCFRIHLAFFDKGQYVNISRRNGVQARVKVK
jgi:hypothetical protein